MNAESDGMCLDFLEVRTRAHLIECTSTDYKVPYLGYVHRVDGEVLEIGFRTLASLGEFILSMNPQRVDLFCGASENEADLRGCLSAAASGQVH